MPVVPFTKRNGNGSPGPQPSQADILMAMAIQRNLQQKAAASVPQSFKDPEDAEVKQEMMTQMKDAIRGLGRSPDNPPEEEVKALKSEGEDI